ncbi:MAG: aldehyde dehydrogenase [Tepidanaerobacteraceae bacterium]|jgi:lactaldehyde dehydrogenase/glycolaldehyde dehydrogenase|nr:aldehyde dehydrogenase [Tepidanaerobacteraceae bacterium]
MVRYKVFIDGEFVESSSGNCFDVINPATDEVISRVPQCTAEDVARAVEACRRAQKQWRRFSPSKRADYLKKMAAKIVENAEKLGAVVTQEQGKPLPQAVSEVKKAAERMEYHAEWALRIEGEIVPSDNEKENIFICKEPMGVVACIVPWNSPFSILVRKVAPALITGNGVVIKPSSETPNCALEFAKIVQEVGLPKGIVNVVCGKGAEIGKAICTNPAVSMVTFTGSGETGARIMEMCSHNITKVSLELGGKAPAIVMDDADLDLAARCIVGSKTINAGQVCNCVERVYVHEKVAEEFTDKVMELMKKITIGDGLADPKVTMGPLINHGAVKFVDGLVKKAVEEGAEVLIGGKAPEHLKRGSFYEPTVLMNCRQDMDVMQREIFGPVLPIMTFKTLEEALELANDCEYGLTSSLYTNDLSTAFEVANSIEAGELYINRQQGEAINGYHAGWKKSGIGGDDGRHGMEEFLQTKVVYLKYR